MGVTRNYIQNFTVKSYYYGGTRNYIQNFTVKSYSYGGKKITFKIST